LNNNKKIHSLRHTNIAKKVSRKSFLRITLHVNNKPLFFIELDWTAETPSNSKILKVADTLFKKRFSNEQPKTAEDIHRIKQSIQKFIIENKAKLEKIYGSMDH